MSFLKLKPFNVFQRRLETVGNFSGRKGRRTYDIGFRIEYKVYGLYHFFGDNKSGYQVVFFRLEDILFVMENYKGKKDFIDDEIFDFCERLTGWYAYHGGVGRPFSDAPFAKFVGKSKKWIRVSQVGGLDV